MHTMPSFAEFKEKALKRPGVLREHKRLEPKFKLIMALIDKRLKRKLTQAALAKKVGTKQSAISRLEGGTGNPTVGFLKKVAVALDAKLKVTIS